MAIYVKTSDGEGISYVAGGEPEEIELDIEDVSKLLGHASVNTTMIYAKPTAGKIKSEHIRCVV